MLVYNDGHLRLLSIEKDVRCIQRFSWTTPDSAQGYIVMLRIEFRLALQDNSLNLCAFSLTPTSIKIIF